MTAAWRLAAALLLCLASVGAWAHSGDAGVIVHGDADGAPGWAVATDLPAGWNRDCCHYAPAVGANLVLYQGDWSGEPDRVMVLNVWPRRLPSLAAEWNDDQQRYLQRDPHATVSAWPVSNPAMTCRGFRYAGSDRVDDLVVFCDPGTASGIRLSWSMAVRHADPRRVAVEASFRTVVAAARYRHYPPASPAPARSAGPSVPTHG